MMNQHIVFVISLLFSVSALQGMFFTHKDKQAPKSDNKVNIQSLDDVKKLKQDQQAYRSKHGVFKDEPNNVKIETVEKK